MLKALVTGATGFVGGALLRELLHREWDVRVLIRSTSDTRNLEGHSRAFERVTSSFFDADGLRRAIDGCDIVFHVAGRYSLWNPKPNDLYRDNVDGTRNVLDAARDVGVSKIVYTSTVGALRMPLDGESADESCFASPHDVRGHYKRSKWLAEQCALDMASRGAPVVVVSPSTPVGPNDVKPTPTGRMIVDFLARRMFAYTNTGLNVVSVEDVAVGHVLAAERGVPGRRYILGGENCSLKRLFAVLSGVTGIPCPRLCLPRKLLLPMSVVSSCATRILRKPPLIPWEAARMAQRYMYFDITRARDELGFAPGDFGLALERAVQWFCDNGYARLTPARRVSVEGVRAT